MNPCETKGHFTKVAGVWDIYLHEPDIGSSISFPDRKSYIYPKVLGLILKVIGHILQKKVNDIL